MAAELNEMKKLLEQQRQQIALEWKKFDEERDKLVEEQRLVRDAARKWEASQLQRIQVQSGTIGSLNEFNMDDNWTIWMERFQHYATLNNVDEARKISLFMVLIGPQAYALLRNLCTPGLPADKSIIELDMIMKNHLQSTPSIITERYKFKECKQSESQGIKQYLTVLKELSMNCEFGKNLEIRLRDQFVSGLHSAAIKKRLLGKPNLTYQRAIKLATSLESATKARDSNRSSVCSILDLPDGILVKIILHFNATDCLALGKSCQRFNDLVFGNEELLRNLDFTNWQFTEEPDIQQYFNDENTYKKILGINVENVWLTSSLSSSIGKAMNLVELNILNGLKFESVEELSRFLKPLVHLKRLSVNWPSPCERASYANPEWHQVLKEPLSRLTYLSLKIGEYSDDFLLILQLCQQLEELCMSISGTEYVFESPLCQEHVELSNLKFVRLIGNRDLKAIRGYIMCIVPDSAEWTDFHLACPHGEIYLERNVEVCPELSQVKKMPLSIYGEIYRENNLIDKSWALDPDNLLAEVVRVTHKDAPKKFCCFSSEASWSYRLKIDEIKKLLKDPGYQISYLHFSHFIEKNCDAHLLASAFPNLTELVLSKLSNENSMSVPENTTTLHRRLRRKGSLDSGEDSDARNTDSTFKMLVENTPRLKVLEIRAYAWEKSDWDLDALYLISGWKNLTVIRLYYVPIKDGKFLIDIGKECKKLEEVTLHSVKSYEKLSCESELLQMLQHCENLRKLSIGGMSVKHMSEMFNILSNCSRLAALQLETITKEYDLLQFTSSVENMFRKCQELNRFSTSQRYEWFMDWLRPVVERITSELNRSNVQLELRYPQYRELR